MLTLRPPSETIVPYANSLVPDETASNLQSHPDPSCLTLKTPFSQTLSNIAALWKLNQMRNLSGDNLFGGLRVNNRKAEHQTVKWRQHQG